MKSHSILKGATSHAYLLSMLLLSLTLLVLMVQVNRMREMSVTAGSLAMDLRELRSSVNILKVNIESERLYGQVGKAALEEQATVFVLPSSVDQNRTLRLFKQIALSVSTKEKPLLFEALTFEATTPGDPTKIPARITLKGDLQDVTDFLNVLRWSGYFTIHDVIGARSSIILKKIQAEAPLALPAAEELLRTDLLAYASRPDQTEEQALQDLPDSLKTEIRQLLLEAGLADMRFSLRDVASSLRTERAWPLPLLMVDDISYEGGSATIRTMFHLKAAPKS